MTERLDRIEQLLERQSQQFQRQMDSLAANQIEERDRRLELREDIEILFQTQVQSQETWQAERRQMREDWETRQQQLRETWQAEQRQMREDWEARQQQLREDWEARHRLTQASIDAVNAQIATLTALATADRAQVMADRAAEAQSRADFIAQMVRLQTEVRNILQELADRRRQQGNGNS